MTLSRQQRRLQERMAQKAYGHLSFAKVSSAKLGATKFKGVVTGRTSASGIPRGSLNVMQGPVDPPTHPKKGQFKGACNITRCQAEHDPEMGIEVQWYNRGSLAFYCGDCAVRLSTDSVNARHAQELWGPGAMLCVRLDNEEDKAKYPY